MRNIIPGILSMNMNNVLKKERTPARFIVQLWANSENQVGTLYARKIITMGWHGYCPQFYLYCDFTRTMDIVM
jgi:hypothetical protein